MVDNFSIAIAHVLIALAIWRLISRDDLDHEPPPERDTEPTGFGNEALHRNRGAADHA